MLSNNWKVLMESHMEACFYVTALSLTIFFGTDVAGEK